MSTPTPTPTRIERDDIEAKVRELTGDVNKQVDSARSKVIAGGMIALVLTVLLVFILGRRVGRKGTTIVEVRRF